MPRGRQFCTNLPIDRSVEWGGTGMQNDIKKESDRQDKCKQE